MGCPLRPWGEARQSPLLSSAPKVATSVGMPVCLCQIVKDYLGQGCRCNGYLCGAGGWCLCQPIPGALGKVRLGFPGSLAEYSSLWMLSFPQVTPGHCTRPQHVAHGDSIPWRCLSPSTSHLGLSIVAHSGPTYRNYGGAGSRPKPVLVLTQGFPPPQRLWEHLLSCAEGPVGIRHRLLPRNWLDMGELDTHSVRERWPISRVQLSSMVFA